MLPDTSQGILSFDRDKTRVFFEVELQMAGVPETEIVPRATRMMEEKLFEETEKAITLQENFVLQTQTKKTWKLYWMCASGGWEAYKPHPRDADLEALLK